jgi:hypothetical protein
MGIESFRRSSTMSPPSQANSAGNQLDRRASAFGPGAVICLCWKHARDLIQYDD